MQGNKSTIIGLAVFLGFVLLMFTFLLISQFYSSALNKTPVMDENGVYTFGGDLSSVDSCSYYCNDGWVFVPNATEDDVASGRLTLDTYKDYTYAENISIHSGDGGWYDYDWQYRWYNRPADFCYVSNDVDGENSISGVYLGHFACPNNLKFVYFSFKDINGYAKVYCNGAYSGTIGKATGVFLNNKAFSDYCLLAPEGGELDITIVVYCYDKITNPGIVSSPIIENRQESRAHREPSVRRHRALRTGADRRLLLLPQQRTSAQGGIALHGQLHIDLCLLPYRLQIPRHELTCARGHALLSVPVYKRIGICDLLGTQ